jgi:hypothetical protein
VELDTAAAKGKQSAHLRLYEAVQRRQQSICQRKNHAGVRPLLQDKVCRMVTGVSYHCRIQQKIINHDAGLSGSDCNHGNFQRD